MHDHDRSEVSELAWSGDDQRNAGAEGWILLTRGELIRAPVDGPRFDTREAAIEYVYARAREGSPLHAKAVAIMMKARILA